MRLLLSEMLPLRTTRMLGDFADDQVLPHRLGDLRDTRFKLIKLSDTEWFAADHPMEVTDVQLDDASIASWAAEIRGDDKGNAWTVVVLAAPAPPEAIVTASGLGVRHRQSGRLIQNPADIMEYVLRLAGRAETFPMLRAECARFGLNGAGSLDEIRSIRAWLDEISYSFGAIWTPQAARLYPTTVVTGPVLTFDRENAENIRVETTLEDTCDVLRVSYNLDEATGRALRYVELSARPYRFEGVSAEVVLPWLRTAANAESVGRRILQRKSGAYSITLATKDMTARPCQWRQIVAHPEWPTSDGDPVAMLLAMDLTPDENAGDVTLEFVSNPPAIHVTSHSIAVPPGVGAAVDVQVVEGQAVFGVTDENGKPLVDALVSLDGGVPKKTDAQGKVSFTIAPSIPPKKHELMVSAPGYTDFILDVYL